MRLLKLAVIGFFAVVAVAAGFFVAAVAVIAGFLGALARQLSGRRPEVRRPPEPPHSRAGRRPMKTIDRVDVTVTDVASESATRPLDQAGAVGEKR